MATYGTLGGGGTQTYGDLFGGGDRNYGGDEIIAAERTFRIGPLRARWNLVHALLRMVLR